MPLHSNNRISISVIVPVYNAGHFLRQTIDSILSQTQDNIECIFVDDGSTDDSYEILLNYKQRDSRIRIFKQDHKFAGVARNLGMSKATGKYLCFLDADDCFETDMLESAYEEAEKNEADIVIFGGKKYRDSLKDSIPYPALLNSNLTVEMKNNYSPRERLLLTTPVPWNKIFRRKFIIENKLYFQEYPRINDAYFVLLALMLAKSIGIVDKELVYYHTGDKNSLQGREEETPTMVPKVFLDIQEHMKQIGIYEIYKIPFQNLAVTVCLNALERFFSERAFLELYNSLKEKYYPAFQINLLKKEEFNSSRLYNHYNLMMSSSPLEYLLNKKTSSKSKENVLAYVFPFQRIKEGSHIILYGAGNVGKAYYKQIVKTRYCDVMAWADRSITEVLGVVLIPPEHIMRYRFDYLVIAVKSEKLVNEIREQLIDYHIDDERIVWEDPEL